MSFISSFVFMYKQQCLFSTFVFVTSLKSVKQDKECYIFPSANTVYSFQEIQIHRVIQYWKCVC